MAVAQNSEAALQQAPIAGEAAFSAAATWPMAVLVLLGILALIIVLGWLARKLSGGPLINHRQMKILATLPLGTRERIVLIDVAGQQLLLGVTAQSITTLHCFKEAVVPVAPSAVGAESEFAQRLRQLMTRSANAAADASQPTRDVATGSDRHG